MGFPKSRSPIEFRWLENYVRGKFLLVLKVTEIPTTLPETFQNTGM